MHACLVNLFRAWSYVQSGNLPAAHDLLARAEHDLESLLEPGMLVSLHQRVRSIVDSGVDEPVLSGRPLQVLAALAAGAGRQSVAGQMNLSLNTIKTYARQAFRVLGVHSLSGAVERCRELGIALEPVGSSISLEDAGATSARSGGDSATRE
jgi:DNA-binding NarL/FixJ family response regulator